MLSTAFANGNAAMVMSSLALGCLGLGWAGAGTEHDVIIILEKNTTNLYSLYTKNYQCNNFARVSLAYLPHYLANKTALCKALRTQAKCTALP